MMAMMQHRMAGESGKNVSSPSCCQLSSQPSAPATAQSATEQLTTFTIEPDERIDVVVPSLPHSQLHFDHSNARQNQHSRAALCTFLI
jgi:hypothetical protein